MAPDSDFRDRVYWIAWNIPYGKWMSYGSLAAAAGNPGAARQVGGMAHNGPMEIPWHRIVKKTGYLADGYPGGAANQKGLLQEEEVKFRSDKIIEPRSEWTPPAWVTCPVIVVVGETASGKSGLALEIAKQHRGSIICADAYTLRQEMDIGTAKPSKNDQLEVTHYLLDVAKPNERFTVAKFQDLCHLAMSEISSKGNLPVVVGGTGLYIDSLVKGYEFLPEYNKELRKKLQKVSLKQMKNMAESMGIDLGSIDANNRRRLARSIESHGHTPRKSPVLRPNTLLIGIKHSRATLRSRIERRVEVMFRMGLRKEVEALAGKYGWECEAMKAIGYREFYEYFAGNASMSKTKQSIVRSCIRLAKKQRTWFKRNKSIRWFEPINGNDEILEYVSDWLSAKGYNKHHV